MFDITDAALAQIKEYFSDKDIVPVRVFLAQGGCAGPQLTLALDEVREGDKTFEYDGGLSFVVDEALMEEAKPVKVDIGPMGFTVESSLVLDGGCGCASSGCGSGCAPGGCD